MSKPATGRFIKLRGVRHNNLKNLNLDLPTGKLIVITGLSGSGKSSLAFDTLFAEGQRRYVETFSPYARQFMDRMDKPQVDSIEGIPPAIAIEQRNSVKSTRSTIGTMTEINDYIKVVWPSLSKLYCHQCGALVEKESSNKVWDKATTQWNQAEVLVVFKLPLSEKFGWEACLELLQKQGYQRVLVDRDVVRISDLKQDSANNVIRVIQDRIKLNRENKSRFLEACEQAYHFGKGQLCLHLLDKKGVATEALNFSSHLHCPACDLEFKEPSPALFNFNHPLGACPACRGFGRIITLDYNLAIPDRSLTLQKGVVKPWQTGQGEESHQDMLKFARKNGVPLNVPFSNLKPEHQKWLIEGDPGYGKNGVEWPYAWYGLKGYFKWLESKSYKMHVRVLLARYRSYVECPDCKGKRFQPATLRFKAVVPGSNQRLTIADFQQLSVGKALATVTAWRVGRKHDVKDPVSLGLGELEARLGYLQTVGLEYLTLDRPTRSLSGGETERVNLTTCLGSRLVNTLFVLDEPSVGLHPRDTDRLIAILTRLRDAGNTVVVVEHEASVMAAADEIIDLGPGHGESGGAIVFQGSYSALLKARGSLTGSYLNKDRDASLPREQHLLKEDQWEWLKMENVTAHNLNGLSVSIPKNKFVCVTGVSGSGKTTLIRDALFPNLVKLIAAPVEGNEIDIEEDLEPGEQTTPVKISGYDNLHAVILIDQSAIGRTPRSNPAVYTGAFDDIREVFAQSPAALQKALNASSFSFNSPQGQCEKCKGAGFEKIEMQFLSDIFVKCPECEGKRYRPHILEARMEIPGKVAKDAKTIVPDSINISEMLESTVDEAFDILNTFPGKQANRAARKIGVLKEVGLGYLRLGQPINTLSGGECQRLKLASYLAEHVDEVEKAKKPALFLFDEPTTGLHFEDVRILLQVFRRLVHLGHSVLVIEHNMDVIRSSDWVIDLGPDAGENGGKIVGAGSPQRIAALKASHTGRILRQYF